MEKYKKKIKTMLKISWVAMGILLVLLILNLLFMNQSAEKSGLGDNHILGIAPVMVFLAVGIVNCQKILKDEKSLKISYNKAKDERTKTIMAKAGLPMTAYLSMAMLLAAAIFYIFIPNITISITLYITAMVQIIISGIVKLIYMKKM